MLEHDWFQTVDDYLEGCFAERTPPRLGELAVRLGLEVRTLSRRFERATGVKLLTYMRARKLDHAAWLLAVSKEPVEKIALRSGFGSRSSFCREFTEAFALSPADYRSWRRSPHRGTLT